MSKAKRLNRRPKKPGIKILGIHGNTSKELGIFTLRDWKVREHDRKVRKRLKRVL